MGKSKDCEVAYLGSVEVGHRQERLHCLRGGRGRHRRWCSMSNSGQDGEEGKA